MLHVSASHQHPMQRCSCFSCIMCTPPRCKRHSLLHHCRYTTARNPQSEKGPRRRTIFALAVTSPENDIDLPRRLINQILCRLRVLHSRTLLFFFLTTIGRSPHCMTNQTPHPMRACHFCTLLHSCCVKLGHRVDKIVVVLQNLCYACRCLVAVALPALLGHQPVCITAHCCSWPRL